MIGLMRGLAIQAYTEIIPNSPEYWQPWLSQSRFGIASRQGLVYACHPEKTFAVSVLYYKLLDACPLRIP